MAGSGFDKSRYSRYTRAGRRRYQRYSQVANLKTALSNLSAPVIEAEGEDPVGVGTVLTVTDNGTWSETPTSFGYQWQRASVNISGATTASYTLPADPDPAAQAFRCVVSPTKGTKTASANSNAITAEA